MSRLQKKCFIASVGVHLLLPIILLLGTALSPRPKPESIQLDNFIAATTVEAALSGGGDNTVKSLPAPVVAPPADPVTPPVVERTPPPPVVTRNPPPVPMPRDVPKEVKPVKPDVTPVESNTREHKIDVSTKLVTSSAADVKAANAARAKAAADKRRALSRAIASINGGVSGSTEVKIQPGPGGGGVTYANFYSQVYTVYYNAWRQPEGVPEVTVKVSVTIAKDGTVINARIVTPSGNSAVDRSVQDTIEHVKFAAPLPESSKDEERTVPINFNIQSTTTG